MENGKSRSLQYGTSKNLLEEVNVTKMEESFLKVESSGSNYYVKIGYNDKHENLISLTAVDGARTWYGEGMSFENDSLSFDFDFRANLC